MHSDSPETAVRCLGVRESRDLFRDRSRHWRDQRQLYPSGGVWCAGLQNLACDWRVATGVSRLRVQRWLRPTHEWSASMSAPLCGGN